VGNRTDAGGRWRPYPALMSHFAVTRAGIVLAVTDVKRSSHFYVEKLGFTVDAVYDDPPYTTLTRHGVRFSLAEQGHSSPDRLDTLMMVRAERSEAPVILVLEVRDCLAVYGELQAAGIEFLAEPYSPPWGGHRFFCVDPDGYLVEIEELA